MNARRLLAAVTAARTAARQAFSAAIAAPAEAETTEALPVQPTTPELVDAIEAFETARVAANKLECDKRAAKKTMGDLAAGVYGPFTVTYTPSARTSFDAHAVRAFYALHGETAPETAYAPSMKITRRAETATPIAATPAPARHLHSVAA